MSLHVTAVLDGPSPRYLVSLPFIKPEGDMFRVCGWSRDRRLCQDELHDLGAAAIFLDVELDFENLKSDYCGRLPFMGSAFKRDIEKIGELPDWICPDKGFFIDCLGWILDMDAETFFTLREKWIVDMVRLIFRANALQERPAQEQLTHVIRRADPSSDIVQAAVWWTLRRDLAGQRSYLEWLVHIDRDNGAGATEEEIIERFKGIRETFR